MSEPWNDWLDVLKGTADPETQARVSRELSQPESQLNELLSNYGQVNRMLFGPVPAVIPVTSRGFAIKYSIFWLLWAAILAVVFVRWPASGQEAVWMSILGVMILWFAAREMRLGAEELAYAGPHSLGTMVEAVQGGVAGLIVSWIMVASLGWGAKAPSDVIHAACIASLFMSLEELSRGHGYREKLAEHGRPIASLAKVIGLHFILITPWLLLLAGSITWISPRLFPIIAPAASGYDFGIVAFLGAIALAGSAVAQTCVEPDGLKGGWQTAMEGAIEFGMIAIVTVVPLGVTVGWMLGLSPWVSAAGVLGIVCYVGFCVGAAEGAEVTRTHSGRDLLRIAGGLISASVAAAIAAGIPVYVLAEQIGSIYRAVAFFGGIAAFVYVLGRADIILRERLGLSAGASTTAAQQVPKMTERWGPSAIGLSLLVRHFESAVRGVRVAHGWA